ncbi:YCF48-related protein, partial [Acinetobacter baumannii]
GDKPLFSIAFSDAQRGLAVGLFGAALQTADGGRTWQLLDMGTANPDGHHLYALFGDVKQGLFIAAEQGLIFRSMDAGAHWEAVQTSNA